MCGSVFAQSLEDRFPGREERRSALAQSKVVTATPRDDEDFPALREDWFRAGRKAIGTVPAAQLRHQVVGSMLAKRRFLPRNSGSLPQWQEIGPRPQFSAQYGNVAGRVTAIAVDSGRDPSGNTLYVGTAYGGLWKSTNGLSANPSFTPLTDSAATLSIGAIALDSSTTPTTIYDGTCEPDSSIESYYGVGFMKSTDDGASWMTVSIADGGFESFYGQSFSKILVDPTFPQSLIACTRASGTPTFRNLTSGIFRSVDWGATWRMVYVAPNGCSDLVYQPSTDTYFAALRGKGIYVSKQSGSSWVPVASPFPSGTAPDINNTRRIALATRNTELWAIAVDSTGNLATPVACVVTSTNACDTGLSITNDGGHTWKAVNAPATAFGSASQGWYDLYVSTPGNNGAVVIGGIDLWWGQWDGSSAANWSNMTNGYAGGSVHPDQHAFAALDETHWYIGNDGGVWTTSDSGHSFQNANATIAAIQFTSVSADPFLAGQYVGGSQDNGTAVSAQFSSSWGTVFPGDGGYTVTAKQTVGRFLTEGFSVSLRRTDDRGASFSTVVDYNTIPDYSGFYVPYQFSDISESKLILGTCRLWRGSAGANNGSGWQPISGDLSNNSCNSYITAIAVAASAPDIVYVATRNGLIWQSNNATSPIPAWTNITPGILPSRPISAIAISPADPNDFIISLQGFDTGHLFRRNAKGTWSDVSGTLPNIPANSITIDPQQTLNIYVGTDAGVFATNDGGTPQSVWQPVGTGLPNTAVVELKLISGTNPYLLAATHGRGGWILPLSTSTALAAPTLLTPVTSSNVIASSVQFTWTTVPTTSGYRLMVAPSTSALPTNPSTISCSGCVLNIVTSSPSYTATALFASNLNYRWQVIAYGAPGQTSPWSLQGAFSTNVLPDSLTFSPGLVNFGNTGLFTSQSQTVQIRNTGATSATLSSISVANPLQFSAAHNCPAALGSGSSCQVAVTFNPQSVGTQQTQLSVNNALNNTSNSMLLSGAAVYAQVTISGNSVDFGVQQ